MNNRKLIITWKPDVLTLVNHNESFRGGKFGKRTMDYSVKTARSEIESFRNIKTKEAAQMKCYS